MAVVAVPAAAVLFFIERPELRPVIIGLAIPPDEYNAKRAAILADL